MSPPPPRAYPADVTATRSASTIIALFMTHPPPWISHYLISYRGREEMLEGRFFPLDTAREVRTHIGTFHSLKSLLLIRDLHKQKSCGACRKTARFFRPEEADDGNAHPFSPSQFSRLLVHCSPDYPYNGKEKCAGHGDHLRGGTGLGPPPRSSPGYARGSPPGRGGRDPGPGCHRGPEHSAISPRSDGRIRRRLDGERNGTTVPGGGSGQPGHRLGRGGRSDGLLPAHGRGETA